VRSFLNLKASTLQRCTLTAVFSLNLEALAEMWLQRKLTSEDLANFEALGAEAGVAPGPLWLSQAGTRAVLRRIEPQLGRQERGSVANKVRRTVTNPFLAGARPANPSSRTMVCRGRLLNYQDFCSRCICSHSCNSRIQSGCPRQLCRDRSAHATTVVRADNLEKLHFSYHLCDIV
jgi:hypothetical protein